MERTSHVPHMRLTSERIELRQLTGTNNKVTARLVVTLEGVTIQVLGA